MNIRISEHFGYKKLLRFVLPSMVMMIVTSIYGVIDGLFISNFVGKTAFASVNLIMPFIMILGGVGFMIGTGGTALVSKIQGENDEEKANRYFTMMIIFAVILGVILTAIGIGVMRPMAYLLGATEDMVDTCVTYGRIVVSFTTFYMLQNIFQSFLTASGKPNLGLIVTVIAGCTNAALDALFIAAFNWGVVGAAFATGIGQVLGGVIPIFYFASKKNTSTLRFKKTKLEIRPIFKACTNGVSELLTNVASSIVSMLYNAQLMAYLGEDGVAAYGVLMYVQLIFFAIEIGYSIGTAPIIAYNYGAENTDELKNIFKKSMIILSISGTELFGLAEALAWPLAKLFVGYDDALCELTIGAFRTFSFAFIVSGITIFASGFFTALNNGLISAVLSILRSLAFQVLFVYLLPYLFGVNGIWWAMFATEAAAFVIDIIMFIAFRKKYQYA